MIAYEQPRRFTSKSPIKHEDYPDESEDEEVNPFDIHETYVIEKGKIEEPDFQSEQLFNIAISEYQQKENIEIATQEIDEAIKAEVASYTPFLQSQGKTNNLTHNLNDYEDSEKLWEGLQTPKKLHLDGDNEQSALLLTSRSLFSNRHKSCSHFEPHYTNEESNQKSIEIT